MVAQGEGKLPDDDLRRFRAAPNGSPDELGAQFEFCRQYLLAVANRELPAQLQPKIGASDLVQQTFLEAQRDIGRFTGATQDELQVWLRRIMLNNVANVVRDFCQTQKRQAGREIPLGMEFQQSVPDPGPSASAGLIAQERLLALQRALSQLGEPAALVIRWRNHERLGFDEIGKRLGRSAEAARKLWVRALDQLREKLESSK